MQKNIAIIHGDGIGVEIVQQAQKVLKAVEERFGHSFCYKEVLLGGAAVDATGVPLPSETLNACRASDGILLGAVGGPKWESIPVDIRPERGLLALRKELGLFANLRPSRLLAPLKSACPLREDIAQKGFDFLVVRELTGGVYFGKHCEEEQDGVRTALDEMPYNETEIRRIMKVAFELAQKREKRLISVDKANVLATSRLWRKVASEVAQQYPDVALEHMLVDNAAMQIVKNPAQFDVVVTENMFGDILSDEASMITGSIGMIASASLGEGGPGLFEPVHGSAPDIAGQDVANPVGTVLSAAMMLRHSLGMPLEADAVESAVDEVLKEGLRTPDIYSEGTKKVSCSEMGTQIANKITNKK